MSDSVSRKEVLDLLARGKINIDEAVELLEATANDPHVSVNPDPVYKAEVTEDSMTEAEYIKIDEISEKEFHQQEREENLEDFSESMTMSTPRWLRIRVNNLETGKNKVTVNIPFGMVKFGLGIARWFNPDVNGVDLEQVSQELKKTESSVLVEVEDEDSNEHVLVFFD